MKKQIQNYEKKSKGCTLMLSEFTNFILEFMHKKCEFTQHRSPSLKDNFFFFILCSSAYVGNDWASSLSIKWTKLSPSSPKESRRLRISVLLSLLFSFLKRWFPVAIIIIK
jgi:hypothetical protein